MGNTSINVYAANGVDWAAAISKDGCSPEVAAEGADEAIDSVTAKTDDIDDDVSFAVISGDLD